MQEVAENRREDGYGCGSGPSMLNGASPSIEATSCLVPNGKDKHKATAINDQGSAPQQPSLASSPNASNLEQSFDEMEQKLQKIMVSYARARAARRASLITATNSSVFDSVVNHTFAWFVPEMDGLADALCKLADRLERDPAPGDIESSADPIGCPNEQPRPTKLDGPPRTNTFAANTGDAAASNNTVVVPEVEPIPTFGCIPRHLYPKAPKQRYAEFYKPMAGSTDIPSLAQNDAPNASNVVLGPSKNIHSSPSSDADGSGSNASTANPGASNGRQSEPSIKAVAPILGKCMHGKRVHIHRKPVGDERAFSEAQPITEHSSSFSGGDAAATKSSRSGSGSPDASTASTESIFQYGSREIEHLVREGLVDPSPYTRTGDISITSTTLNNRELYVRDVRASWQFYSTIFPNACFRDLGGPFVMSFPAMEEALLLPNQADTTSEDDINANGGQRSTDRDTQARNPTAGFMQIYVRRIRSTDTEARNMRRHAREQRRSPTSSADDMPVHVELVGSKPTVSYNEIMVTSEYQSIIKFPEIHRISNELMLCREWHELSPNPVVDVVDMSYPPGRRIKFTDLDGYGWYLFERRHGNREELNARLEKMVEDGLVAEELEREEMMELKEKMEKMETEEKIKTADTSVTEDNSKTKETKDTPKTSEPADEEEL